jgi:serine/threonine protein kinase/WD40 repeat protein
MKEREIFEAALAIDDEAQRELFLREACNENLELRKRVEGAVKAHRQLGSFLERPAADFDATADLPGLEQPGQMIGPYKLRERIGAGGMGVVWAADQKQPLRRRVALKLIKPGMDSEQILARFEMEREALAMMDHPNIARVLDAGTTPQGRPFFAMELIRGVPITEYCDAHSISIPVRLKMFTQVCSAVQHAHQKGIIHRDIKPLNVLVTEKDGRPTPKIIDFGVAKAIRQPLTEQSVYSGVFQAIGTVAYMSPEQAGLSATDIDSRADVYGLGVLLYELLTGDTPFDKKNLASAALDEACRIIREEDPPKPSLTISTMGERASAVSKMRGTDPANLGKLVRGDLDWIVMKALEKDRNRRYESASNLNDDINRYLIGEPVSVSPPSQIYRFRRFCRRNKGMVTAIAIIAVTLIVCTTVSTHLAFKWRQSDRKAQERLAKLQKQSTQLADTNERLDDSIRSLKKSQYEQTQVSYSLAMMSAYMEWANANPVAVERLLGEAKSYLGAVNANPGVEWNLLWNQVQLDFADHAGTTLARTGPFVSFEFSPDSCQLAIPVSDSGIHLINLSTYERKQVDVPLTESGEKSTPVSATFSNGGDLFAYGVRMRANAGQVTVMELNGSVLQVVDTDFEPWRMRFSNDGSRLEAWSAYPAQNTTEAKKTIWSDASRKLSDPGGPKIRSPNLADPSRRRAIKLHDAESGNFIKQILESADVETHRLSPDGTHMATLSLEGRVKLWDLRQIRKSVTTAQPHWFIPLVCSPDGETIVMAYETGSIKLWNPHSGETSLIKDAHSGYMAGLAVTDDGRVLASGGFDGKVHLWDLHAQKHMQQIGAVEQEVWAVAFSDDGRYIAAGGDQGEIHVWDCESGELIQVLTDPGKLEILGIEFLPSGDRLLACSGGYGGGTLKCWDIDTKVAETMYACGTRVDAVEISPDKKWIAICDRFGNVLVYSTDTLKSVWRQKVAGSYIAAVKFSSDSSRLFCAGPDGITIYRCVDNEWLESGRLVSAKESFRKVLVLPGDDGLVTACENGAVRYWPITSLP